MHTFYAVPDAVVNAVLAAVISKSIDYFFQFVGIPFIISPASATAAASFVNRVLCIAGSKTETTLILARQRCAATPQRRFCSCRWPI